MKNKTISVMSLMVSLSCFSLAAEGRWSLSVDKKTGTDIALLQTESKKRLKILPLEHLRDYSPIPYEDIADKKRKARAMRRGDKYTRLTAKNSSATPIDGGRLLVFQEQTIVMPPQLEATIGDPHEQKKELDQEPENNAILVTLFDDTGTALWSRKFGPLAGRLPSSRKAWALPTVPEPSQKEIPAVDPPKK